VELIAHDTEIKAGNRARLVQLVEAKVLPHFDFAAMTALAAGPAWGKATPEQKKLPIGEFKGLLHDLHAKNHALDAPQAMAGKHR